MTGLPTGPRWDGSVTNLTNNEVGNEDHRQFVCTVRTGGQVVAVALPAVRSAVLGIPVGTGRMGKAYSHSYHDRELHEDGGSGAGFQCTFCRRRGVPRRHSADSWIGVP